MQNPIADPFVEVVDTDALSPLVRLDATESGAATITLNRPAQKNAFNAEVIAALNQTLETLEGADGVRVVFVRGVGGTFSAGADLEWMRDAVDRTESDNRDDAMEMAIMLRRLYELPALTVALVEGGAFGGGAGLVAACDLGVTTRDARFAFSEVKLGLIPATVSPYVIAAIGPRKARSLFATGRVFDAEEALRIGLVDEIVEDAGALDRAMERIATETLACAPEALEACKKLVADVAGRRIDHPLMEDTANRIARARVGEEGQEGVRAFLARKTPSWAS
ncbi:MAG TPA: enoyl-CoA hydratase-related protein [Caulobacteraceae bacterium]|nr:enoyl-CoA hydratase-related protein [Caulobacteraceae bacterium]